MGKYCSSHVWGCIVHPLVWYILYTGCMSQLSCLGDWFGRHSMNRVNCCIVCRGSARSDTHLMAYQHQNSSGSVSSDSSPRTASTQLSNPFVFDPSPQPDAQFYYTGSSVVGPSGSNTLGPAYPSPAQQQLPHSTHSLPSYYHPQHSQSHSAPVFSPPPPSQQSSFEMINNPYYKKFQLQNVCAVIKTISLP